MTCRFIYCTEVDLSRDNGPGINEREFVEVLLSCYGEKIKVIVPRPERPDIFFHPEILYVHPHKQFNPFHLLWYAIDLCFTIKKTERAFSPSALVFRLGDLLFVPTLFAVFGRTPIILKTLALFSTFGMKHKNPFIRLFHSFSRRLFQIILRRTRAADTVSFSYREWLSETFGFPSQNMQVIPNGANTHFFSLSDSDSPKRQLNLKRFDWLLGYVGALDNLRNLDLLLHACAPLVFSHNLGLVLVGSGKQAQLFGNLAKELGIASHVIFQGRVPYKEVPLHISAFDIVTDLTLVKMPVGSKMLFASYSQKIPQYLACGRPVISWDVPDNRFIKDNHLGWLARPYDIDSLRETIQKALETIKTSRNGMAEEIRQFAKKNVSIESLATQRWDFWSAVVSSR